MMPRRVFVVATVATVATLVAVFLDAAVVEFVMPNREPGTRVITCGAIAATITVAFVGGD
jgi:hypothetical protein